MKNVFAFVSILIIALWQELSIVVASPAAATDRNIIRALENYISAEVNIPIEYKPFDAANVRDDTEVEIVTTQDEAAALSERYDHKVRIDTAAGELIYILVPDDEEAPTRHVGTLRGEILDLTLNKVDHYLRQDQYAVQNGTTPADVSLGTEKLWCAKYWCIMSQHCVWWNKQCTSCIIFWCA